MPLRPLAVRLLRRKWLLASLLVVFLAAGCVPGGREIRAVVATVETQARDQARHSVEPWGSGIQPTIDLPVTATPAQVAAVCVRAYYGHPPKEIKQYQVLATERVLISTGRSGPPSLFTAVLIASDQGKKVFLLQKVPRVYTKEVVGGFWSTYAFSVDRFNRVTGRE